jgi:molecular chaperone GrpE (heat shock protein)
MAAKIFVSLIAAIMAVPGAPVWGQRTVSNFPSPPASAQQMPEMHRQKAAHLEQLEQTAEQNKAAAQKDTERLSQMVNELKQELEKTPAGTLPVSAVKKSKEIEKLAKRVRKEMQGD